jgi:wyosine [tRNA(Phe)-imidazoG37] synthetase (radical SAM superfamily)
MTMQSTYRFLFGPVPSRRLGSSLGVDLTPFKTCCQDCVFCQLGQTTHKTIERKEYVSTQAVIAEIKDWLAACGQADYITLSGSGEPTLHSGFGKVLEFIRANTKIPPVLLTNGNLLFLPEVRKAASLARIVKISLNAWDQSAFTWVNRPHRKLNFDQVIGGHKAFRTLFEGELWMEVFLIPGINAMPTKVAKIAALAREIAPDRIQLNTAVRPPSEDFVTALDQQTMSALAPLFQPKAEIIADFRANRHPHLRANQGTIYAMLMRRPCTAKQIAAAFDMHLNEVLKYLGLLINTGQIRVHCKNSDVYYIAV